MKTPLLEAVKEAGRYAVFFGISTFVSILLERLTALKSQDIYIITTTLILRAIDKYLHELRKNRSIWRQGEPSGLLPF